MNPTSLPAMRGLGRHRPKNAGWCGPTMNPVEVEKVVAPAAIERALAVYRQMRQQDHSVLVQARKILTQHIYGMVDRGEHDEQRLIVGGLVYLKAVERDHKIKSAQDASVRRPNEKAST